MSLYEYICPRCLKKIDVRHSYKEMDTFVQPCPTKDCHTMMTRCFSAPAVILSYDRYLDSIRDGTDEW